MLNIGSTLSLGHWDVGWLCQHIDNTRRQNSRYGNESKDCSGIIAHVNLSCKETLRDFSPIRGDQNRRA
jgi:hypothetical protein